MQALSPSPLQPPVSLLEKTPTILEVLLRDVPPEVLDWKPAPERWSISEVMSHMLVIEHLYGERAKRIVVDEKPVMIKYVPPDESQVRKKVAGQSLDEFAALWGTCGRLPNSIVRMLSTLTRDLFRDTPIPSHERAS